MQEESRTHRTLAPQLLLLASQLRCSHLLVKGAISQQDTSAASCSQSPVSVSRNHLQTFHFTTCWRNS